MPDISLRFKIILLFCLLGLLPQIIISYISVDDYTQSLEEIYERKVSQLVDQVADQTEARAQYLVDDLAKQASQPYLQLSFQQYPQQSRLQLLGERLELYRNSGEVFNRLHLCYLSGERLAGTDVSDSHSQYTAFEKEVIAGNRDQLQKPYQKFYADGKELAFFIPVKSFRQPTRVIGVLVAYLPVEVLTQYLRKIDFGEQTAKIILTEEEELVEKLTGAETDPKAFRIRSYSSTVSPPGWSIIVKISEAELFHDVISLKTKSALFIAASLIMAFAAWFVFSHRFTRPFNEIVEGAQVFATGNLDHRIALQSGYEAKRLASAFNNMAGQLKERQEELNQSARLASLGVMTAGLAHEIKNPLAGIKTSVQVIGRIIDPELHKSDQQPNNVLSNEDCRHIIELSQGVSEETNRLTKLLNDMLEFGRPRKPQPVLFNIAETVSRAVSLVRPEYEKRDIQIINRAKPSDVNADSDQILQVILNLLKNSLQSVSDHTGRIELLSDYSERNTVLLIIRDNGKGIPDDKLQRIFDPFYSLSAGGTGLGLSVVYTLLKQNGARLDVTSSPGEGSEFTITFPVINE